MSAWERMRRGDFDADATDQPLALFPEPDRCETPDMFDQDVDADDDSVIKP